MDPSNAIVIIYGSFMQMINKAENIDVYKQDIMSKRKASLIRQKKLQFRATALCTFSQVKNVIFTQIYFRWTENR